MLEIYQKVAERIDREQSYTLFFSFYFCYMMPSEIKGSKVQNRQRSFLPWSIVKLWQPLLQSTVGTKMLPGFKNSWKKMSLPARVHKHRLLVWEVLKPLIAGSACWQSIAVCLWCDYGISY